MAAAAILNIGKMSITLDCIKISCIKLYGKIHHVTKSLNRKLIRVTSSDECLKPSVNQWCLRMLLGIKWYQFVWNDNVWRLKNQPKLTAIIQSRRLGLFGHIMRMDDNADAKMILLASPPADWKRQLRSTPHHVAQHRPTTHLTLPEAADLAQNCPLWRMMSTYGATQS